MRPGDATPRAVELVKRKIKSEVWRLVGAAGGAPLIAKRCLGETAKLEDVLHAAESLSLEAEERTLTPEELDRLRGLGYFR